LSKIAVDDLSRRLTQRAFQHVDLRWTPEGGMSVPWPDRSFDTILCSHVIEHVPDDEHLVGEFARALKPGGRAHLLVPLDAPEEQGWIDQPQRRNPNFPKASFHVWNYNLKTFTTLVQRAGLEVDLAVRRDALLSARAGWPRPIQMASSIAFSILPRGIWWAVDEHYLDRRIEGKQAAVIARRPL
jgi:SAM-dependent methyltransferase